MKKRGSPVNALLFAFMAGALGVLLLRGAFTPPPQEQVQIPAEGVYTIAPQKWRAFLDSLPAEEIVILDVRTPGEVARGSIRREGVNFLNLDFYSPDFEKQLNQLDKNKTYFVYCRSGNRSGRTAKRMQKLGFRRVFDLMGGIIAYQREGLPVAQEDSR